MGRKEARLSLLSRHADAVACSTTNSNTSIFGEASFEFSTTTSGNNSARSSFGTHGSSNLLRASETSTDSTPKIGKRLRRRPSLDRAMASTKAQSVIRDVNRLKFSRLGLHGRESEIAVLYKTHERWKKTEQNIKNKSACDGKVQQEIAGKLQTPLNLISVIGASGTGKSMIVREFGKQLVKKDSTVFFVSGKFEQHRSRPYAAFITAFSQICLDAILNDDPTMRTAIFNAVGAMDYHLLLDLIPNIGELVYMVRGDSNQEIITKHGGEDEYDIVKSEKKRAFLLQRFLTAVASSADTLFVLEDLQWIDTDSLVLLETILTEDWATQDNSFLVICTHRKNEVDESHPFSQTLNSIEEKRKQTRTNLIVENLSPKAVHGFITELLNSSYEDTAELADIAFSRVQGNIFYLVQFLTALRDGGFLRCNLATMKWTWDDVLIRKSTVVAGNVLTILMDKMSKLPCRLKSVLLVAACLGSSFDEVVLTFLDGKLQQSGLLPVCGDNIETHDNQHTQAVTEILETIVEEGLLEALSIRPGKNRSYCFAHDQIEQAAKSLVESDKLLQLQFQIGHILFENKKQIDYQSLMFTIVNMLNEGSHSVAGLKKSQLLIDANVEAGIAAIANSAFGAAVSYLKRAIALIPEDKRLKEHCLLSLQLYNALIKAEYSLGNWDDVNSLIQTVVTQKNRPIADKAVAYSTMVTILAIHKHDHAGAINLAVEVLGQLGATFHPRLGVFAVVGALVRTKLLLRKVPVESLLDQAELQDNNKKIALDIITAMNSSLYASNPELLVCFVLKTLRWSLKYGVSKDTPKCVGVFALLEMAMGNTKAATSAAYLSIKLAEKHGLMATEYAPMSSAYGFVLPWTTSLHDCKNSLYSGFDLGQRTGDLEYAYMNAVLYCFFCFCLGKPLNALETDMRNYGRQMRASNQALQLQFLCLTWQTTMNLMGRCHDPLELTGEAMNQDKMLSAADIDKNPPLRAQVQCHRLQLAVYYRDFNLAGKLISLASNIAAVNPCNPIIWRTALFEGVTAFELVRQKRNKWKSTALKAVSKVQKWVDAGNVNCVHILYLLQAEQAAMQRKRKKARGLFDKAIVTAARNGFRNDRALASERCAEWHRFAGNDDIANDYLHQAFECYTEMEAFGKLDEMATRYPSLRPCYVVVGTEKSEEKPDSLSLSKKKLKATEVTPTSSVIVVRSFGTP